MILYRLLRWLAPRVSWRWLRELLWLWKWRLWHRLYGGHVCLWDTESQ